MTRSRPTGGAFAEAPTATNEWYTPPDFFHGLGRFDVDPASPGAAVVPWVPAARHVTREEDGRRLNAWPDGAAVWNNPPYGTETPTWVGLNTAHAHRGGSLMLVFNRSDNAWFQAALRGCSAFKLLRGRIAFVDATGKPGDKPAAGSVLFAFGENMIPRLYSHTGPYSRGAVCFPGGFT